VDDVQRFSELLALLAEHGVECVVVGGVAAVLAGAPIATFDLDLVPDPDPENLERLPGLLERIDATCLDAAGRTIRPSLERLRRNRMNIRKTRLGRLDVAAEIGDGVRYETTHARSTVQRMGALSVRVLDLELVIETKEFANRDKDRATLPVLRETLRLKRLQEAGG
jgi:hypothetical protein